MDSPAQAISFTRTLRLKVKRESWPWLNAAAIEVNQVFNYCNETSILAATRTDVLRKWLSGFDLCKLTAGATDYFERIGSDTIQSVCNHYAQKRIEAKRLKLRWRISRGDRRSLGWVPFKAASLTRQGTGVRFCGKTFRVFEAARLDGVKWQQGCFAQNALGEWWLCLPVNVIAERTVALHEAVGIDLGIRTIAATSEGEKLEPGCWTRGIEAKLAMAQRRGHKRQAKRLHLKAANRRKDALHKFSRKIVDQYQNIVIGDVSSTRLAKTRMAKSVLDSGWGMLIRQLQYKGEYAGRCVSVVSERNTTRACSSCGALAGPSGLDRLVVRQWCCPACGAEHDRDVNAARNILAGSRCLTSVRGNEPSRQVPPSQACRRCDAGISAQRAAA
jgi:putative transposase